MGMWERCLFENNQERVNAIIRCVLYVQIKGKVSFAIKTLFHAQKQFPTVKLIICPLTIHFEKKQNTHYSFLFLQFHILVLNENSILLSLINIIKRKSKHLLVNKENNIYDKFGCLLELLSFIELFI